MEKTPSKTKIAKAQKFFVASISGRATRFPDNILLMCTLCKKDINCTSPGNMVPHLRSKHFDVYKAHIDNSPVVVDPQIVRLKLIHSCVELVTINGKTFSTLQSSGFVSSHEDKLWELKCAGCPLNLKDEHLKEVKEKLRDIAAKIRQKCANALKGKILPIMIDAVTRHNRSLLGLSTQYVDNGKTKTIPIAVTELTQAHTAKYLSHIIKKALDQYEIGLKQIFTVTSDNASNMIATTKELEIELNRAIDEDLENDAVQSELSEFVEDDIQQNQSDEFSAESIDHRIHELLLYERDIDQESLDMIFDQSSLYDSLLNSVANDLRAQTGNEKFIDQIRCAAHTIQLAVKEALGKLDENAKNIVGLCRQAAKFLRKPSSQHKIILNGVSTILPVLDIETRWNSTYLMVSQLKIILFIIHFAQNTHIMCTILFNKSQLKSISRCKNAIELFKNEHCCGLLLHKWEILHELLRILKGPYTITLSLQQENCTLSDLFGYLLAVEIGLIKESEKANATNLAQLLIDSINKRKHDMLSNRLMIVAVYLDPRYRCQLPPHKIVIAKLTIEKLWERIQDVEGGFTAPNIEMNVSEHNDSSDSVTMDSLMANVDEYFEGIGQVEQIYNNETPTETNIVTALDAYDNLTDKKREKSSKKVLEFWEEQKNESNIHFLYDIAKLVLAIPPTQSSVERLFSILNFIFSDRRYNLKMKTLEDIMLINLNENFFYEVIGEEVAELVEQLKK